MDSKENQQTSSPQSSESQQRNYDATRYRGHWQARQCPEQQKTHPIIIPRSPSKLARSDGPHQNPQSKLAQVDGLHQNPQFKERIQQQEIKSVHKKPAPSVTDNMLARAPIYRFYLLQKDDISKANDTKNAGSGRIPERTNTVPHGSDVSPARRGNGESEKALSSHLEVIQSASPSKCKKFLYYWEKSG